MMDNDGAMNTMLKALAKVFPSIKPDRDRLRCAGHIMNLVCKAILLGDKFGKTERQLKEASPSEAVEIWADKGALGKLHNLVVWLNWNDQRRNLLRQKQRQHAGVAEQEKIYTYELIVDGGIRWNSCLYMIERALELRDAFRLLFIEWNNGRDLESDDESDDEDEEEHPLRDPRHNILTENDWDELQQFYELLLPLEMTTKEIEGRAAHGHSGAVWEVIKMLDYLFDHIKKSQRAVDTARGRAGGVKFTERYRAGLKAGESYINKYYTLCNRSPIYRMAIALHPGKRLDYFHVYWKASKASVTEAERVCKAFYEEYAREHEPTATDDDNDVILTSIEPLPLPERPDNPRKRIHSSWLTFGDPMANPTPERKRRKAKDEWERYTEDSITQKDCNCSDPLAWWLERRADYPILSKIAINLFSIPAMSAEAERVFSSARRVIDDERNHLGDDVFEAIECQKHWIRNGLVETSPP